ncbi:hypothetical protein OG777_26625 [Micromonospora peucetia]|uniref:Uncharacterized protein n=1 Tax=Micromonospora peucetia TaxID=47871 RepID=A0A1C6W3K3_9ACTN|nr:hypothetical protein [Micromonospora peucetia]MCX4390476.1 hypothetical protein [Micromonospora peucetia]WSA32228.1 hypothetical protein OIE14_29705 [Micromonospora peucetia]SCL73077.1 hypothetical protein GA0070608_5331 [Micromonospora peucetia]
MRDANSVLVVFRLLLVIFFFLLFVLGVRLAVSRRFPVTWARPAHPTEIQQSRQVRVGVGVMLVAASQLILEGTSLIPMPFLISGILLAVAMLVAVAVLAWFVVSRE